MHHQKVVHFLLFAHTTESVVLMQQKKEELKTHLMTSQKLPKKIFLFLIHKFISFVKRWNIWMQNISLYRVVFVCFIFWINISCISAGNGRQKFWTLFTHNIQHTQFFSKIQWFKTLETECFDYFEEEKGCDSHHVNISRKESRISDFKMKCQTIIEMYFEYENV